MFSTYRSLVHLRIRWHTLSTARVLMRHWHWFLLSMLLVPMGATLEGLLQAFAYPLTAIFSPENNITWYFTYVVVVQLMAFVWALLQRNSIRGGEFMSFAASLPIPATTRIGVNLTILLAANSILLIAMTAAVIISANPYSSDNGFESFATIALLMLTLVAQLATLERTLTILATIFIADWTFALSLTLDRGFNSWLLMVCAIGIAGAGLYIPSFPRGGNASRKKPYMPAEDWNRSRLSFQIVRIQINALVSRSGSTLLIMASSIAIAAGGVFLMTISDHKSETLALPMAMAMIALILSGIYRTLFKAHAQMDAYSAALPLGKYFWSVRDTAFVTVLGVAYLAILIPPVFSHVHISATTLICLCLAYGALLATLRVPVLFGGHQTVLLSLACTIVWAAAVIAMII